MIQIVNYVMTMMVDLSSFLLSQRKDYWQSGWKHLQWNGETVWCWRSISWVVLKERRWYHYKSYARMFAAKEIRGMGQVATEWYGYRKILFSYGSQFSMFQYWWNYFGRKEFISKLFLRQVLCSQQKLVERTEISIHLVFLYIFIPKWQLWGYTWYT